MSSVKITSLLKLTQEAGIALSKEQAAELVAKYPGAQARTIFKQEFARQAQLAPKATTKPAAKNASTTKAKTKPAVKNASTLTAPTTAPTKATTQTSTKSAQSSVYKDPDLDLSTYNTLAQCREEQINPEPIVVEYLGRDKGRFQAEVLTLERLLKEDALIAECRYYHPATSLIYNFANYKMAFDLLQGERRDHLSPREYFNDQTTDVQTLARKKRYHVTAKKLTAFLTGTYLKAKSYDVNFYPGEATAYGLDLFEFFDRRGFNVEQWAERLVEGSSSLLEIQRKIKMAIWYFHKILATSGFKDDSFKFDLADPELQAYAFWMYDLLERHQVLGTEQLYFIESQIPSQGWKAFKEAGHKGSSILKRCKSVTLPLMFS